MKDDVNKLSLMAIFFIKLNANLEVIYSYLKSEESSDDMILFCEQKMMMMMMIKK